MNRLKRPKGIGGRRKRLPTPEGLGAKWAPAGMDEAEQQIATWGSALGDSALAKRVQKLQREEGHGLATLPELVAMDWLKRRGHLYAFQPGRVMREASPPDILVLMGGGEAMAWQIHGNYWHSSPGVRARDMATQLLLPGQIIMGREIRWVVELWESRLIDRARREQALSAAIGGVEMGP